MTTRTPADDDLLLEATEALETTDAAVGAGRDGLAGRLANATPALQAEVKALRAVKAVLADDASWGLASGTDAPPPHLLDAILRAEVAARPDAIRQAITVAAEPPAAKRLWARLSSWLVGSGVVVGAAAAIFITIQRSPAEPVAPSSPSASTAADVTAPTVPTAASPEPVALKDGQADPHEDDLALEGAAATTPVAKVATLSATLAESQQPLPPRDDAAAFDGVGGLMKGAPAKPMPKPAATAMALPDDSAASVDDLVTKGPAEKAAPRREALDKSVGGERSGGADVSDSDRGDSLGMSAGKAVGRKADGEGPAASGAGAASVPGSMPAAEPTLPPPPAQRSPAPSPPAGVSSGSTSAPRIVSAEEARQSFLRQREMAKDRKLAKLDAVDEARGRAKNESESKAKAKEAPKSAAKKMSSAEARESADEAREQMAHQRSLQEANGLLVTAERELSIRRFDSAVDLAMRAEAIAGSGLGLAPASTLVRGFVGLRRFADAARVASRLLQGSPADGQLVDGMMAGAQAALQIGDQRLAERLLERAASVDNKDPARRQLAQQQLKALRGKAAMMPAKRPAEAAEAAPAAAPAEAAADSP